MSARDINPYTQAMRNCVQGLQEDGQPVLDQQTSQFLANMVQGRFAQYLSNRMAEYYHVENPSLSKQLNITLMHLMSMRFFVDFRKQIKAEPSIIYTIAKKIIYHETEHAESTARVDALYISLCKKYLGYENIDQMIRDIQTNPGVRKIIFLAQIEHTFKKPAHRQLFQHILNEDQEGITPIIFNRYLQKNKIERLINLVETGDWKVEADFYHKKILENV